MNEDQQSNELNMQEWRENAKFVLEELKRLNRNIEQWEARTDESYGIMDKRLSAVETNQAVAAGKSSVWAIVISAIVSTIGGMVTFTINKPH